MNPLPIIVGVLLIASASMAHAENWVDTHHDILIDVDSIRQASDGLVYYLSKSRSYDMDSNGNPAGTSWGTADKAAFDCRQRISYSSYSIEYEADWRSKGEAVRPGTMGAELFDFVCSRVHP